MLAWVWTIQAFAAEPGAGKAASGVFNVREYGAAGDGVTLDTAAIRRSVEACAQAGGGQVLVPPGRYMTGTVRLRSHTTLFLAAGATLIGTTNLALYERPAELPFTPAIQYGDWNRGLIVCDNAEDITICGPGTIDGNRVFDPTGEEHMRGPHTITFAACHDFAIRDVSILDAANYAIFFLSSDQVEVRNVRISGGWDGVHFRGAPGHPCRNVNILHSQFYTGDDAIAGSYWDNTVIFGCVINSSCNGIRLIGPAEHLQIANCLFYGPGKEPHRTSDRHNMLSGIILQPGAWGKTEGLLDDVVLANNTMHEVASPMTIWTQPGCQAGRITISGLDATGVYRSAFSAESWSETPITNVVVRNARIEYAGGIPAGEVGEVVNKPATDVRPLPVWGFYGRNISKLTIEDTRFSLAKEDQRPVVMVDNVTQLNLDTVHFTHVPAVSPTLVITNVDKVNLAGTELNFK